ncbi:hypothetical protein Tsubulata_024592 [Turnera subulata]|uniref:Uncharacterized protein n=1 Tax=Turnera subulata TaxID=218843 RepID=A0A9Q0GEF6_9ROSI|nr:hypothetical protein Tsubulata_024592 [Turnera subulata]
MTAVGGGGDEKPAADTTLDPPHSPPYKIEREAASVSSSTEEDLGDFDDLRLEEIRVDPDFGKEQPRIIYTPEPLEEGICFNEFWVVPETAFNDEESMREQIPFKGLLMAPTQQHLDKFLKTLGDDHRNLLATYFQELRESQGFEVSNVPCDDTQLPFPIVRPVVQPSNDAIVEMCGKEALSRLEWLTPCFEVLGIMTLDSCLSDMEHRFVEMKQATHYLCGRELYFITFTAENLTIKKLHTFRAILVVLKYYDYDYSQFDFMADDWEDKWVDPEPKYDLSLIYIRQMDPLN